MAIRVSEDKLRFADTTLTTKNQSSVLSRLATWLENLCHLIELGFAPDEEVWIDIRRLAKADASGSPKAEVLFLLDRNYQQQGQTLQYTQGNAGLVDREMDSRPSKDENSVYMLNVIYSNE
jgi:hypothetical protein